MKTNGFSRRDALRMFSDDSVLRSVLVGCGVFLREYFSNECYIDQTVSKRIINNTSFTVAGLHAVCEGLQVAVEEGKDTYIFFVDRVH